MRGLLKPVDLLSLAFIAFLLAVTLIFASRLPHAGLLVVRYLALAVAVILSAYAAARTQERSLFRTVHAFLPVLVIPVLFDSMGDIIPWVRARTIDALLIKADQLLFDGSHLPVFPAAGGLEISLPYTAPDRYCLGHPPGPGRPAKPRPRAVNAEGNSWNKPAAGQVGRPLRWAPGF